MSLRPRAVDIIDALESRLVYIPGGRDREGRPLIVVNMPSEPQPSTKAALEMLLRYSIDIFSEETKSNGFTILVDAHREAWRVARPCIRQTSSSCGSTTVSVIVLRPDGFWEKHVDNCTKSHKEGEPLYIPIAKLSGYVENSQLPPEFGGSKSYDHSEWIQTRIHVEDYLKDAAELVANLSELHERLCAAREIEDEESEKALRSYGKISGELGAAARHILRSGKNVAMEISRESSQDVLDTVQRVHTFIESIETKQVETRTALVELEQHLGRVEEIHILEEGVARVTNWILGPADSMLNMRHRVGFDVVSSEELRRDHEALELQCRDTYGRYAELLHKIDGMAAESLPEDLKSQRDFMDFVCRSFASRLERRRNVLITSQRFFRLVSEYFDRTSEVFDKLVMGNKVYNFSQAGSKLLKLEKNQSVLEAIEREVVKEGEKLSDVLSMPVKDALGRDIRVDYGEDIANVRDILDATIARKNIFSDSVELQKLTLKQVALIHTYENDAEQAVEWIGDLFKVLIKSHVQIGCNVNEIQSQKDEHLSFQETAKGTYDYGCQLLNGARVLRMSCRLPLEDNTRLSSRLWQAWRRLRSVGQEQLTRLRVCAVFHRSVEDHCARLRDLIEEVVALRKGFNNDRSESPAASMRTEIRGVLANREKLLLDVGRMVRLGRLLRTRLKESFCPPGMSDDEALVGGGNLTAVEAISTKLAEVTRLAERLDSHLCDAGARSDENASGSAPGSISPAALNDAPKNEVDVAAGIRNILENSGAGDLPEFTGSSGQNNRQENSPIPNDNNEKLVSGDDYATATECSTTPVIQSRSESFATASDCGDTAWWDVDVPASDVENVEIPSLKTGKMESRFHSDSEFIPSSNEATGEQLSGVIELPLRMETEGEIPEIDRSNASSTIVKRTIEEKSGKILKEVTETTTLRVSQSTHFGVTSYKLTSNTLRGNQDHTDVHEMQDLREFVERDLKGEQNHLPEADQQLKPMKEITNAEITSRDSDSSQDVAGEHSRLLKFTRASKEDKSFEESPRANGSLLLSLEESNERLNSVNSSPSGAANINDSGIETTPKEKYSKDEEEVLQKMKEVSRGDIPGNSADSRNTNGLINHCLLTKRAVRSAARFDFMLGEIY